eukprot:UN00083
MAIFLKIKLVSKNLSIHFIIVFKVSGRSALTSSLRQLKKS